MESIENEIVHFSHEHPLILKVKPPKITRDSDSDSDDSVIVDDDKKSVDDVNYLCNGCNETISSLGPYYYTCPNALCDYHLHILCAKQPQKIDHPFHPEHHLILSSKPPNKNYIYTDCCEQFFWRYFTYSCQLCRFNMDIICAAAGDRKYDNPHHKHPLYHLRNKVSAMCNACGVLGYGVKGIFYQCSVCINFLIHKDCALLPSRIMIQPSRMSGRSNRHHQHPLTLTIFLSIRYNRFKPTCAACRKKFDPKLWLYSCDGCRYFVHICCVTILKPFLPTKFKFNPAELKLNEAEQVGLKYKDDDHNLLQFPFKDQSHSLLKELSIKRGIDLEGNKVNDYVHHHKITLFGPQNNIENQSILHNPMKRTELICTGCVRPITKFPYYKCLEEECKDFVLHEWCARLPNELAPNLFHKKCSLTLFPVAPYIFKLFQCRICNIYCNGFAYGCVDCGYFIDVRCALLPDSLKHETHEEHRIILKIKRTYSSYVQCEACHNCINFKWGYICETCNFGLCPDCVLFPKTLMHKYDRHTLNLAYNPIQNHLSDYFCDICEEELDPFQWFHHCIKCDQSFHIKCTRVSGGVKYGGILNVDYHPHPLQHAEWFKETKMRCANCDHKTSIGFRCVECNYAIDYSCAIGRAT